MSASIGQTPNSLTPTSTMKANLIQSEPGSATQNTYGQPSFRSANGTTSIDRPI
jgi:hypothetical protein